MSRYPDDDAVDFEAIMESRRGDPAVDLDRSERMYERQYVTTPEDVGVLTADGRRVSTYDDADFYRYDMSDDEWYGQ